MNYTQILLKSSLGVDCTCTATKYEVTFGSQTCTIYRWMISKYELCIIYKTYTNEYLNLEKGAKQCHDQGGY